MINKKIKVTFLAPETKGGPYFVYKEIVEGLKEKYSNNLDIFFINTKKDYLKLQFGLFGKIDVLFSVIPFIFRPIGVKKYIYNLHGNYEIEKKYNNLGNKLLYFSKNNLKFSDNIMLSSYFLSDKLNFKKKYEDKILIIPNGINFKNKKLENKKIKNKNNIKILTISSTKFLQKGMGIIDLGNQLSRIKDKNIIWTIIAGGNEKNKEIIQKIFYKNNFGKNINIKWLDWVEKDKLEEYYLETDIFLYGTRLETWGGTIMEAMSFGLPVILLEYELWKYIYPDEIITNSVDIKIKNVIDEYGKYSNLSNNFVKKFDKDIILKKILKLNKKG